MEEESIIQTGVHIPNVYDGSSINPSQFTTRKWTKEDLYRKVDQVKQSGVIIGQGESASRQGAGAGINEDHKITLMIDLESKEGIMDTVHELVHLSQILDALQSGLSPQDIKSIIENKDQSLENGARILLAEIQACQTEGQQWLLQGRQDKYDQHVEILPELTNSFEHETGRQCPLNLNNPFSINLADLNLIESVDVN